jgi:hypothetical protein
MNMHFETYGSFANILWEQNFGIPRRALPSMHEKIRRQNRSPFHIQTSYMCYDKLTDCSEQNEDIHVAICH